MAEMKRVSWKSMCGDCPEGPSSIMHNENHPGFAAVQGKIEKEGYSHPHGEGERHLLDGVGAGVAKMRACHRDCIEPGHLGCAEFDQVPLGSRMPRFR